MAAKERRVQILGQRPHNCAVLSKHPQDGLERAVSDGGWEQEIWRAGSNGKVDMAFAASTTLQTTMFETLCAQFGGSIMTMAAETNPMNVERLLDEAATAMAAGELKQAEDLYRRSLVLIETQHGPDSLVAGMILLDLLDVYDASGDKMMSRITFERIRSILVLNAADSAERSTQFCSKYLP